MADKVAKEAQVKVNNGKQGYNNRRHISKHEDDIIHFREDYNYQYNHNRKGAESFHNSHHVDIPIIMVDKRDGVANNVNQHTKPKGNNNSFNNKYPLKTT